jgi:hypothetical protein
VRLPRTPYWYVLEQYSKESARRESKYRERVEAARGVEVTGSEIMVGFDANPDRCPAEGRKFLDIYLYGVIVDKEPS